MSVWVPVREAAIALGVSEATLKRKLKTGEIQGQQERMEKGWRWLVEVDEARIETPTPDNGHEEIIVSLRSEVEWLRGELERRGREVAELHVLLQQVQHSKKLLLPPHDLLPVTPITAPPVAATERLDSDAAMRSNKTPFWKRLFSAST
jgi:hypothetical protein